MHEAGPAPQKPQHHRPMTQNAQHESPDLAGVRREAATRERNEILLVIEEYARRLAHGHGATGAQILQQVADAIARRGEA